jgi:hypothetical protein
MPHDCELMIEMMNEVMTGQDWELGFKAAL